ncbi:DUF4238 domain-containing protein [Paenibacillus gansuensis]|uniref:DUF4238 domain-containing protein n=1 Tax=Paenibacillus gansuensis TaxID=306542 RepID=A0ABW5PHR1_9BACL
MSDIVKNQHYIPQSVLKHFAFDGRVYEALVEEKKEPYQTPYNRSMSERYTYEHPYLTQNKLEKFFQDIEDDYAPAIVETLRLIKLYETGEETIDVIEKHVQAYLEAIIIYYYRSGALLHEFSHETKTKETRIAVLLDKLLNTSYIKKLGKTLREFYEFAIIKSDQNHFLISDQYISTVALRIKSRFGNVSNRHLGMKDVMILVPFSSQYYVVFYNGRKPDYIQPKTLNLLTGEEVLDINKVIINNSYKKCVGREKNALIEALSYFEWSSPSSVYIGHHSGRVSGSTLKKEIFFYERDKKAWELFTDPMHFSQYNDLGRNDPCGCNSGKKFKLCCYVEYEEVKRIWRTIKDKNLALNVSVHPTAQVEQSIFSF